MIIHIVKRQGHEEHYDPRKVYASAYRACMNAHLSDDESEKIAEQIQAAVDEWITGLDEVGSKQIFERITTELKKHNQDAAFLYETHKDVN